MKLKKLSGISYKKYVNLNKGFSDFFKYDIETEIIFTTNLDKNKNIMYVVCIDVGNADYYEVEIYMYNFERNRLTWCCYFNCLKEKNIINYIKTNSKKLINYDIRINNIKQRGYYGYYET